MIKEILIGIGIVFVIWLITFLSNLKPRHP